MGNPSATSQQRPHVLVIDDDKVDVKAVTRALFKAQLNCLISVADNGVEGLRLLRLAKGREKEERYAGSERLSGERLSGELSQDQGFSRPGRPVLILLDLNMPQMDGFEFLDHLRADPELMDHVVFVMTTSESQVDRRAAYLRHAAGYLLKSKIGDEPREFSNLVGSYLQMVELPT